MQLLLTFSPQYVFSCSARNSNFQLFASQTTSSIDTGNPGCLDHGLKTDRSQDIPLQHSTKAKDKIKEALLNAELSVSSYDTAWVAMVQSPGSPNYPCFPRCVHWILENQHPDGSWGHPHNHSFLIKDALSSTLACILALQRWNVGEEHVKKGLQYIGSNLSSAVDRKLHTPIGFDIIFPSMIGHAIEMDLDLPMHQNDIDAMFQIRESELKRGSVDHSEGTKAYHAYVAEGLSKSHDWREVMKFQKRNGSLFNSPSATAAALIHTQDEKSLGYLHSVIQRFGDAVPTLYPLDIYTRLCIVDNLERLGISWHFSYEIRSTLDSIYRRWVEKDEEIYSDIVTCAMAFRILRMHGYDVSSDAFALFEDVHHFNNSIQGHLKDVTTVLELYKASEIRTTINDQTLKNVNSWSSSYLKEELSTGVIQHPYVISDEVDYLFKYPFYANLERLEHKRNIEHCNVESFRLLKSSYINHVISNKDLVKVAVEDFNICQSTYRKELEYIESWVKANKLDQLAFARQKQAYCYLSAAATLFSPEMSDARICWAKNSVLTTVVDDFFDVGSSREEQVNLITLVKKWDGNHEKEFCSEQVKIIFCALYNTINEIGAKAWAFQKHSITNHIIETWLNLMESMMKEAEWLRDKSVVTLDDYMGNAYVSFALGPIVLPALYFVGEELSEDVIRDPEYHKLYELMSTCGRLLNDMQGFEREGKEGKLNSVSLRINRGGGGGSSSIEEAKREIEKDITCSRTELLKLVLQSKGSVVPRACKDVFWKMCRVVHVFYMRNDGFTSPKEMVAAVHAVIREPLNVSHLQLSKND